jgi:hypothetical protein
MPAFCRADELLLLMMLMFWAVAHVISYVDASVLKKHAFSIFRG